MVAATLAKRAISELFTQQVRAPTVSGSAAEAKRRSIYFFRDICRVSAFSIFSSQSPPSKSLNNGAFGYLCSFVFCVQWQHKFFFVLLPAFTLTPWFFYIYQRLPVNPSYHAWIQLGWSYYKGCVAHATREQMARSSWKRTSRCGHVIIQRERRADNGDVTSLQSSSPHQQVRAAGKQ